MDDASNMKLLHCMIHVCYEIHWMVKSLAAVQASWVSIVRNCQYITPTELANCCDSALDDCFRKQVMSNTMLNRCQNKQVVAKLIAATTWPRSHMMKLELVTCYSNSLVSCFYSRFYEQCMLNNVLVIAVKAESYILFKVIHTRLLHRKQLSLVTVSVHRY